jgi:heme A synthase
MTSFQRLCILTCAMVFALIVIGGIVRATDSGLGCPDWPLCHGKLIPSGDKHTLIEYSHRLTGTVVGLLGLSILIAAVRFYRQVPAILYVTCLGFVFGVTQAALGGAAVLNDLPPEIVVVHLAVALTILTLLVLLTTTAFAVENGRPAHPRLSRDFGRLALLTAAGALALMLVGSYVSGAGYSLACSGWPLCNGDVVPRTEATSVQLVFTHRFLALAVGLILLALTALAWRARREAPLETALVFAAAGVFVVQSLVGAANVWTRLADEVAAAHLAFGTLLWLLLALLNIRVHRLYELLPFTRGQQTADELAGAAR